jgi:hypothetical protein
LVCCSGTFDLQGFLFYNVILGVEGEPLNIVQEAQEKQMNQFVADNLAGLIKTRFKATLADKLMDEVDREPEWLVDMMKNPNVSILSSI